jgi:hypothetical protein
LNELDSSEYPAKISYGGGPPEPLDWTGSIFMTVWTGGTD